MIEHPENSPNYVWIPLLNPWFLGCADSADGIKIMDPSCEQRPRTDRVKPGNLLRLEAKNYGRSRSSPKLEFKWHHWSGGFRWVCNVFPRKKLEFPLIPPETNLQWKITPWNTMYPLKTAGKFHFHHVSSLFSNRIPSTAQIGNQRHCGLGFPYASPIQLSKLNPPLLLQPYLGFTQIPPKRLDFQGRSPTFNSVQSN